MSARLALRRQKPSQDDLVRKWAHPAGTPVNVRRDDGTVLATTTRSGAWLMGGHSAMILVEGISGGYSLNRVSLR